MYTSLKDKRPLSPSPTPYVHIRRFVPRHAKSYLWLGFLTFVFGLMLMSDNEIPITDFWPRFGSSQVSLGESVVSTRAWASSTRTTNTLQTYEETSIPTSATQKHTTSSWTPAEHNTKPRISSSSESHDSFPIYGTGSNQFNPNEVLILLKTGATTLYRRLPIHFTTSLSDPLLTPNVVIYSDQADTIAGHLIVDVLANVSDTLKQSSDFKLYRTLPTLRSENLYPEAAAMEGDHYLPGGWRLDKYKFLPLVQHAATYHPGYKWYIYMEDDNYFFWHSLYTWLASSFDPTKPHFLGSPAAKLGEDFAHGGSGFMVSGAALSQTFGADPSLADKYESYAAQHCCGDQVLSHIMKVSGVPRYRGHDHTSFIGLQALPTWKMAFGKWNWCSPLLNIHKVHQADVSRLHAFEKYFHQTHGTDDSAVMTWSYLFKNFVASTIFNRNDTSPYSPLTRFDSTSIPERLLLNEWDSLATEKWHTSSIEADEPLSEHDRQLKPWFSAEGCERACEEWEMCLSWKFQDDNCGLSSTISAGMRADEGVKMVSGYLGTRIRKLVEGMGKCGRSEWVPAS